MPGSVDYSDARDRRRPGLHRQPPRMREHNAELLSEAGFAAGEIERLAKTG